MIMEIYMLCLCQNFLSKTFEPFKLQIGDWCTGEGTDSFCSLHDGPRNNLDTPVCRSQHGVFSLAV
jgi:hypothetical protein